MQPFAVGTGPGEGEGANSRGADYGTTERTKSGSTRRRAAAGMTYYGEDSGDDFGEEDSDGESVAAGAKRKGTPLQRGGKSKEMPSARESPAEDEDAGKSYLGLPPPGNKVMVRRAQKTPHQYL